METVTIPKREYELLKETAALLKDREFLQKLNRLAEIVLAERWGVVMPQDTSDLAEAAMAGVKEWKKGGNAWDGI